MRAKLPTRTKLVCSLFLFLIVFSPTLFFLDAGIRLSQTNITSLLLKISQTNLMQPPDPLVSWLSGSFWRLIFAYLFVGFLFATKVHDAKNAYKKGIEVTGVNLMAGTATYLLSLVFSGLSAFATPLQLPAAALEISSASYLASLFCIWGRVQEPFITFIAHLLIAPVFSVLGWWIITKIRRRNDVFTDVDFSNPYIQQRITPPNPLIHLNEGPTQTFKTQKPIVIDEKDKSNKYVV